MAAESDTSYEQPATPLENPPLLRVVKGDPSPEELAALVAVVSALSGSGVPDAPALRSNWAHPRHRLRTPLHRGPGAWTASAR